MKMGGNRDFSDDSNLAIFGKVKKKVHTYRRYPKETLILMFQDT